MPEFPVVPGRPCAVAATLELVGDRWSLLIAREIMFGNRRFSQIARNTGAPRDRLAARLKSLVAEGILEKHEYQATRFEYHLTESGRELLPLLVSLLAWGDRWAVAEPPMILEHHGHRVRPTTVCGECGEAIDSGGFTGRPTRRGGRWRAPRPDGPDAAGCPLVVFFGSPQASHAPRRHGRPHRARSPPCGRSPAATFRSTILPISVGPAAARAARAIFQAESAGRCHDQPHARWSRLLRRCGRRRRPGSGRRRSGHRAGRRRRSS